MALSGSLALFVKVWFVLCLVVKSEASLRNQLQHLLESNGIDYESVNSLSESEKRSLSSIARNGMVNGKRNIGSLARSGILRATPDEIKRSIAALAKNSQLPTSREPETEENEQTSQLWDKRNIGSLARSGMITGKRNIASLARSHEMPTYGKRNLASVVRSGRPSYAFKRNIASLARGNIYPYFGENIKRNVGALARDWSLPKNPTKITVKREAIMKNLGDNGNHLVKREALDFQDDKVAIKDQEEKKNIGSLKSSQIPSAKVKRETIYDDYQPINSELLEPVYQSPELDYEELNEALNELYANSDEDIHEDKRFLGSVVRDGWSAYRPAEKRNIGSLARMGLLRSDQSSYEQQKKYYQQQEKRHIGALARPGTTPYKSIVASRSPSLVKDAKTSSAGQLQAFPHGDHHVNLPQYTNEVFGDHFIQPETINDPRFATNFPDNTIDSVNFETELPNYENTNYVESERNDEIQNEMLRRLRLNKLMSLLSNV